MARYSYDVNTTRRYIDVHKQFQGGLKTVDTDDSLGAVFLREAENVSLSEFGFIEKRYGTFEKEKTARSGTLQGYFEFMPGDTMYRIYFAGGYIFVNDGISPYISLGSSILKETEDEDSPNFEKDWRYPADIEQKYPFNSTFKNTNKLRDINGVQIGDILYIFTGTYPIYAAEVDGTLKFYWFSVDIPTYDEIVVVGHNLLEDDYEGLYFENIETLPSNDGTLAAPTNFEEDDVIVQQKITNLPKNPYVRDSETLESSGTVKLVSNFKFPSSILATNYPINSNYYELDIDTVGFRSSGPGASSLDFTDVDLNEVEYDVISNYNTSANLSLFIEPEKKFANQIFIPNAIGSVIATKTSSVGGQGGFDFAKVKGDVTTLIDKTYIEQNLNEKMYISLFHDTQDINGTKDIYTFEDFDALIGQESAGEPFSQVFADTTFLNTEGGFSRGQKFVEITPYRIINGEPSFFEDSKITINDVTISNKNYVFTIPNTLNFEEVDGYKIALSHIVVAFDDRTSTIWIAFFSETNFKKSARVLTTYPATYLYGSAGSPTTKTVLWNKTIGIIDNLPTTNKNFVDSKFEATIKNLLSGTFDFIFRMTLTKYELQSGFLAIVGTNYLDFTFSSITITEEKLQDYPGSEGVEIKPHPIWSCNRVTEHFNKLMVWGSLEEPNSLFYSFPDRPTFFPSKFYLDFGTNQYDPIEAVTPYMNILVVQTGDQTWGLRGNSGYLDSPAPYTPFTINSTVGAIAPKSVRAIRNHLFFLSKQGVIALKSLYAADEQYNIDFMDRNIRNIVPQDSDAVGIQYDNQYWLNFSNYGITLRWYIDKKAWVKDTYGTWSDFNGVFKYQIVNGQLEFITHPSTHKEGQNSGVYKIGVDYSLPTDLGDSIKSKFETSFLNQNYPFHPKNYKEAKMDFTLQNEYNLSKDALAIYPWQDGDEEKAITVNTTTYTISSVSVNKNHRYRLTWTKAPFVPTCTFVDVGEPRLRDEDLSTNPACGEGVLKVTCECAVTGVLPCPSWSCQNSVGTLSTEPELNTENVVVNIDGSQVDKTAFGDNYIEFLLDNDTDGVVDITFTNAPELEEGDELDFRDVTYDNELSFLIQVVSENDILNQDLYQGYLPAQYDMNISLKDRLGDWTFGQTDFGRKVTAVDTIKLSGRGYNAKIYLEDTSKSKWTLESIGITFKMKRARSR